MAVEFAGLTFGNELGLYGLLSIVPLIILYLIRPKPKLMVIPSLMFVMKMQGYNKLTSFLKQITRDWLFLIQLLALLALALMLAHPFTLYDHDITAENTVIVIDASASSQIEEGGQTRFALAIDRAKQLLGAKNTIIFAKNVPTIAVKDGSASEAIDALNLAKPKDTGTRLGDAIILAGEALGGREGRVIVLSDFVNTAGQDPLTARALLEGRGITVDFISTASESEKSNVGFTDLTLGEKSSTAFIKNFDAAQHTLRVELGGGATELTIAGGHTEPFVFETPGGKSKLHLAFDDDFPLDNDLYIAAPERLNITALLITSNGSVFVQRAMQASEQVELTVAELPIVPKGDYDVYIIANINPKDVLAGTFEDIAQKVEQGASVIIHAQEGMANIDYRGLLDASFEGVGDASPVTVEQVIRFTKNIDFGQVDHYPFARLGSQFTPLATAGPERTPLLAIAAKGKGKVVYIGITESGSDFRFATHYPIFWTELLRHLADKEDLAAINRRTGETAVLDKQQEILLPSRERKTLSTIILDQQGIYQAGTRSFAANLLNEVESDMRVNASVGHRSTGYTLQAVKERREFSFEIPLLIAAGVLLLLEILYIKIRGDL